MKMTSRAQTRSSCRAPCRGLVSGIVLAVTALAQAAEPVPLDQLVAPGMGTQASFLDAVNAGGVVEANSARVENGVVYLDYVPAPAVADTAAPTGR